MGKTMHRKDKRNDFGTVWSFRTPNFLVALKLTQTFEAYDGDDEDGSTQRDLENGDLVMFDSEICVEWRTSNETDEEHILSGGHLGMSVYRSGETLEFLKGGYFRDMLKNACDDARTAINRMRDELPVMRE